MTNLGRGTPSNEEKIRSRNELSSHMLLEELLDLPKIAPWTREDCSRPEMRKPRRPVILKRIPDAWIGSNTQKFSHNLQGENFRITPMRNWTTPTNRSQLLYISIHKTLEKNNKLLDRHRDLK
jgi:hypothetical protein